MTARRNASSRLTLQAGCVRIDGLTYAIAQPEYLCCVAVSAAGIGLRPYFRPGATTTFNAVCLLPLSKSIRINTQVSETTPPDRATWTVVRTLSPSKSFDSISRRRQNIERKLLIDGVLFSPVQDDNGPLLESRLSPWSIHEDAGCFRLPFPNTLWLPWRQDTPFWRGKTTGSKAPFFSTNPKACTLVLELRGRRPYWNQADIKNAFAA